MTEAINCPKHGQKCTVTTPRACGLLRVRCAQESRCVDAYYVLPPCVWRGHSSCVRIRRVDANYGLELDCSACGYSYHLEPVDHEGRLVFPVAV